MTTKSLIDAPLWDRAGWFGVAFLGPRGEVSCPRVGLLFQDRGAATAIFSELRRRIGPGDVDDELRVAFLQVDVSGEAPSYTVLVGSSSPDGAASRAYHLRDSGALAGFEAAVAIAGRYLLTPIVLGAGGRLEALEHLTLEKWHVAFRRGADLADLRDPDVGAARPSACD
jgi:hypothetical protein